MGNSTGSTFIFFGIIIVVYIVGMLLYTLFQKLKKRKERKNDERFGKDDE